jgi:hypothetical protein
MTDILFPPAVPLALTRFRYLDSTGITKNPYTGAIRTMSLLGDRIGATLETSPAGMSSSVSATDRAAVISFIARMQGRQNRVLLWDQAAPTARGSFPATELYSNGDFSNGLTGWTDQANVDAVVADRVYRLSRKNTDGTTGGTLGALQALTLTQFLPYVWRSFVTLDGGLTSAQLYRGAAADSGTFNGVFGNIFPSGSATTSGMRYAIHVPGVTGNYTTGVFPATNTDLANDFQSVHYMSAARCALVDMNANLLLQSDDFTATWTNSASTDSANTTTDPSGGTTADSIIEDTTVTSIHSIAQSVTAGGANQDFCFTVCLKANTRTWARLVMTESTGGLAVTAFYNLATGVIGAAGALGSANWIQPRSYSVSMGNGWWRYYLIGRKTSAAGTLTCRVDLATGDGVASYTGDGTSSIFAWRGGLGAFAGIQSVIGCGAGLPFIPAKTTTTAVSTGLGVSANATWLKGLPPSANGVLLPGDWVELITSRGSELKLVTAALNSDAAGCGLLNFAPRARGTLQEAYPIIINRPMGRFVYTGAGTEWTNEPGLLQSAAFDFEEAS